MNKFFKELQRQSLWAFTPPPGCKALCGKGFECLTNKKHGFTLAEILISLLILGVIASLTIPSLIQNTHKKEEVVKIKKGLSVINQAISMDKALTGEDLSQYESGSVNATNANIINMFKKRLSISDVVYNELPTFLMQDGLGFMFTYEHPMDTTKELGVGAGKDDAFQLYIITKPCKTAEEVNQFFFVDILTNGNGAAQVGDLNGAYYFVCSYDRCIPSEDTAAILNAADPTKAE